MIAHADAAATLVDQGMPDDEVRLVLSALDPRVVRRHLELHRERVIERQVEERNVIDAVERVLLSRVEPDARPRTAGSSGRALAPSPGPDDPGTFGSLARSTRCS